MSEKELFQFLKNEYGNNTELPELEKQYMAERGLTKSNQWPTVEALLGQELTSPCPIFDHAYLYDLDGTPHTLVIHPYKNLKDKDIQRMNDWCEEHGLRMEIDNVESWYSYGRCHVIELIKTT